MLNRYATAILGSLGTILVLTSYVAMYRNGTGAIYLGLLGFALIGSAMLVQRVNDLTLEVEGLECEVVDLAARVSACINTHHRLDVAGDWEYHYSQFCKLAPNGKG